MAKRVFIYQQEYSLTNPVLIEQLGIFYELAKSVFIFYGLSP